MEGHIDETLASLPQISLHATRAQILAYFRNGWMLTEMLFSGLANEEAFYRRPYHQLRHPLIFYYAHPVVLYVNKLRVAGLLDQPVNAHFEALFEVGVDEMRWDDLHEGEAHLWPTVDEVRAYRAQAYDVIVRLIETHPLLAPEHLPITQASPMWALVMGFEHERIHLETSSVLMRELPIDSVRKPGAWPPFYALSQSTDYPQNPMIAIPASEVVLGKPSDWPTFGWDNEYGNETRPVHAFAASKQLISNGEFLEFVKAGGYANEDYWSREGWAWRRFRNIKWPTFWIQDGPAGSHQFKLRTIFEILPMQYSWPVCVNFHEAKAYCAWRSKQADYASPYRLITEAEHHALRNGREEGASLNHHLTSGGESPVDAFPANAHHIHDVFGNVWQWCEDHFHPLAGSAPHPYYDDFSAPCYDGEHQMILGGSFISTGDEASIWARFHFRPHFFQHAGFRLAQNVDAKAGNAPKRLHTNGAAIYETKAMLDTYLLMHWGINEEIWDGVLPAGIRKPDIVHLPIACAELVMNYTANHGRVLDIGCAVGRSSFELARGFHEVVGIDYSREFVDCADLLKNNKTIAYRRKDSGEKSTELIASVDAAIPTERLHFEQGDACALPLHLKNFDAVLLANTLCRLADPIACLERMQGSNALVKPGGTLVMTTPFSWLEAYTPKSRWLDGISAVQAILTEFELVYQQELPFVIREHRRKFEYIVTLASVWRRKLR
jgi:5-histidylcysteine sulfoxide synthase/putative 4-mercaptohistidine N1-methyltranferase